MTFFEDPRLRQRWNQIAQDAEAVTENAAAGIWSFQHNYINPCFGSVAHSIRHCTATCFGDSEERVRRRREREQAEHAFDFYDDWYEDENGGGGGGILGSWGGEDWDRLLAGTGSARRHGGAETVDQPRRKRGMSYGTRGGRRKSSEEDPTIIPSTQPIGFLSKLPWKMGGTLRYKPSAADLQEHPGKHGHGEGQPLLGSDDDDDHLEEIRVRKRSGTTGSGDTSDSYRSRGDLFPSDGEGEEDAVPLDDEVTYDMIRRDDRSSGRTRSGKGKRPVNGFAGSRTVSRTTIASMASRDSHRLGRTSGSVPATPVMDTEPSLEDLAMEETVLREQEDEELARKQQGARQRALERGLKKRSPNLPSMQETKPEIMEDEYYRPMTPKAESILPEAAAQGDDGSGDEDDDDNGVSDRDGSTSTEMEQFVPARLPNFG